MIAFFSSLLIGGGLGALLGRLGRCRSGACPLLANWKRGAVYGAVLGLLFYSASGCAGGSEQPPKNMKQIVEANFDSEVTQAKMPVVVDFYAPWCGPCRMLSPRLDALAGDYSGKIKFVQVNVDNAPSLSQKFNVQAIPMVLFFGKDGKLVTSSVGLVSVETLRSKLNELIAK
jgi:thioredoxin